MSEFLNHFCTITPTNLGDGVCLRIGALKPTARVCKSVVFFKLIRYKQPHISINNMKIDMKAATVVLVIFILAIIIYFLIPDAPPAPCTKSCMSEGFNNLNANYATLGTGIKQIYDTVYLEQATGNIIDVTVSSATAADISPSPSTEPEPGPAPAPAPAAEPKGDNLTINSVFGRNGGNTVATTNYTISGTSISNTKSDLSIMSAYDAYNIVTNDKVQVFVMPWDKETYLGVFDLSVSPPKIVSLVYVPDDGSSIKTQQVSYALNMNTINVPTDDSDNKLITMNLYSSSRQLYQVCHNVFFDVRNGSLIMVLDRGINVYERFPQQKCETPTPYYVPSSKSNNTKYTPKSETISDVGLCAWIAVAEDILAIYIANEKLTMISTFCKEPNKTQYTLINCVRFLGNGTRDDGTTSGTLTGRFNSDNYGITFMGGMGMGGMGMGGMNPYGNNIASWMNYWDNITGGDISNVINNSNYMLKSQYVPPTCANCPSCNGNGVCLNCGGKGGCGTQTSSSNSKTPSGENVQTPAESVSSLLRDTGSGMRDLLKETGSGLKEMVKDTGSGLKSMTEETGSSLKELVKGGAGGVDSLARDTASGTVDLAKDTAKGAFGAAAYTTQGAVGLGKEAVGGTVGLGKDVVKGTVGLGKEVVGGTLDLAKKTLGGAYNVARDIGGEAKDITYDVARTVGSGLTHLDRDIHAFGGPTKVQTMQSGGSVGGSNIASGGGGYEYGNATSISASTGGANMMGGNRLLPGSDPMSYFGKMPNTGESDFIPVTTDFSAFRK